MCGRRAALVNKDDAELGLISQLCLALDQTSCSVEQTRRIIPNNNNFKFKHEL